MAVTISTFRPVKDDRYVIAFERERPHPEPDEQLIITFERTADGIRSMLAYLLDQGFSVGEVAQITSYLRPLICELLPAQEVQVVPGRLSNHFH